MPEKSISCGNQIRPDQPTENWTKFPNNLLDNIDIFDPPEWKIISLMIRKTLGFSNPNYDFSVDYIALKTGLNRSTVMKKTSSLLEKGAIKPLENGTRGKGRFTVNWSVKRPVGESDQSEKATRTGRPKRPEPVGESDTLKETIDRQDLKNTETVDTLLKPVTSPETKKDKPTLSERVSRYYNRVTGAKILVLEQRRSYIERAVAEYGFKVFLYAIHGMAKDRWSIENSQVQIDRLLGLKRDSNIEKYSSFRFKKKPKQKPTKNITLRPDNGKANESALIKEVLG